ncbi:MAG: hypothetical protein WKF84_10035 [Pyrinomonadaceae bacterium]
MDAQTSKASTFEPSADWASRLASSSTTRSAKLWDNVGGPNGQNGNIAGGGTGARTYQNVDTVRDIYGVSHSMKDTG